MIRVVLADNHALFRAGIRRLLEDSGEVRVVGEAGSSEEALAVLAATPADVAVLDIQMPGPGIQTLLASLGQRHPGLRCIVLSVFEEEQYAVLTRRAGALGYLTKGRSPEDLLEAVRRAHQGLPFVSEAVERRVRTARPPGGGAPPHAVLSTREQEVLRLLATGKSLKQISAYMACSPKTVSTFRARILKKMGFRGNADIVRYVQEQRLET